MSFKSYTEKIQKKTIGICSILGRILMRIHWFIGKLHFQKY